MTRLRPITESELDDAQRRTWEAIVCAGRRTIAHPGALELRGADGGLV